MGFFGGSMRLLPFILVLVCGEKDVIVPLEGGRGDIGMTMTIVYLRYLKYVVRHKYFVMKECFRSGLIWRGMLHDNSKFLPSEFIPYAKFFYGNVEPKRDDTGYYKPTDTGCVLFDFAWLLHQKRNDHHWQWWILPEDNGGIKVLEMSYDSIIEMVCDWVGAGKAQGFASPPNEPMRECQQWYESNKHKMNLHATTRAIVEYILYCNDWEKRYFPICPIYGEGGLPWSASR